MGDLIDWNRIVSLGAVALPHFGDPQREFDAARYGAAIIPVTQFELLRFHGSDAQAFLQGQMTCDVDQVTRHQAQFGEAWLRNLVKVQVSVTNASDPSFWSWRVAKLIPLFDNLMRDHSKLAFYDASEEAAATTSQGAGLRDPREGLHRSAAATTPCAHDNKRDGFRRQANQRREGRVVYVDAARLGDQDSRLALAFSQRKWPSPTFPAKCAR